MGKLSKSELVKKLALKSFKECDLDNDGSIDVKELHVGLLLVYDKLNKVAGLLLRAKALPVYIKPPKHEEIHGILKKYDADASGKLSFEEFHECVSMLVGTNDRATFTESLPFKIFARMALKMLVFPLTAWAIKSAMEECAGEESKEVVRKVPNGVLVFAVEGLYKAGKLAFQERGAA
ncbi:hypothetical protein CHLNCDRAFT_53756 [Chlorella variabilis]|uniref:EF-hand domain-containing protein n=1 Tax=Chlorella variabilis TaxID=554065 RepID=E1ZL08_CHLVA|nr:hypothetical protein CHLNCDRAFT_53756 [Chlorella variabilis]EFN53479.1 hypothetical protein CHLNCDRAFT_53756 [Chlorella variabilis]|eukprot:XP_005845581.1 hypothetical protein CHLNCDRAFT_53756 [Chlorella variabilis]